MGPSAELLLSFAAFLVLFLGIGAFAAQRSAGNEADYLLGGRTFGESGRALAYEAQEVSLKTSMALSNPAR
jgi:Na+/proline symporter